MPVNYANSRIYRIVCNVTGKQYFGSTTQSLAKRLGEHKTSFKQWRKGKCGFYTSFEIIEGENYDIVLVEELPDIKNVEQLRARERFHIEASECVNKNIPNRTIKERYENNKEELIAYQAEYRAQNKEKIAAYKVERYAKNKEKIAAHRVERVICEHCGAEVGRHNIARHQKTNKCLANREIVE